MKKYLIREFTEFNLQRMNPDDMPMAMHVDNPELSQGAFDKHIDQIKNANIRLNTILNQVLSTNTITNKRTGEMMDGMDIEDLKIIRIIPNNEIDLNIFITFKFNDKEYFGVIERFVTNPKVKSEMFRDPELQMSKEWKIKISGYLIKAIKKWMNIPKGTKWQALKEMTCTDVNTGELISINQGDAVKIIRSLDNSIIIEYKNANCELKGMNFYYFNYWFENN